jgi:hypothetical protein
VTVSTRARRGPDETTLALIGAYLLLSTLFLWQAWRRETPTIFTDELEIAQLSRSIAETGEPARRGVPHGFTSLVPWFTAPFWWIPDTQDAYAAIRSFQALVMAAAIFPAYGIARFAVGRPWALFAAIAAIATPALSYAPILVEEPFAYPLSALALWLILRAALEPTRGSILIALAGALLAMLTRSQLIALPIVLLLTLLAGAWRSEPIRRWRAGWTRGDWVGAGFLALLVFFAVTAFIGSQSADWETVTAAHKDKIVKFGAWAAGGFAVGVGLFPAIALLAILLAPARERQNARMRAFLVVAAASLVTIGWYAAIKGAYVSTRLSDDIVERNLIYLVPLATAALAAILERAAAPVWALASSGAAVFVLVVALPTGRAVQFPYYEAHGVALLALLNRELEWTVERIDTVLLLGVVVATSLLCARTLLASRRAVGARIAVGVAAATLILGLTNEIYAEIGEHDFSQRVAANLTQPYDWIDRAVGDGKTTVLAQTVTDPTGIHSFEFWNRSITQVWSLEGSAPGPGGTVTPDLASPDGTLVPAPGTEYVLQVNGVDLVAPEVARGGQEGPNLVRVGDTFRLRSNQLGVQGDGWFTAPSADVPARAAYNRFEVAGEAPGVAVVMLSRETFCPTPAVTLPGEMTVRIGPIAVGEDKQPALGRVTASETRYVPACASREFVLPVPDGPWRIELEGETFVPAEIDPQGTSDSRHLAARVVSVRFVPR